MAPRDMYHLAQQLFIDGIVLITGIRNNMKNILMENGRQNIATQAIYY